MSRAPGGFALRLALPDGWLELPYDAVREDPDAVVTAAGRELAGPGADAAAVAAMTADVVTLVGLWDMLGALNAFAYAPGHDRVAARLLAWPWPERPVLRRATPERLARGAAERFTGEVTASAVTLPAGPAARLHGRTENELGDDIEAVLHLLAPPGLHDVVALRMEWAPGDPDAAALAAMADDIARSAAVDAL